MAKKEIINNDAVTMRVNDAVTDTFEGALDVIEDKLDDIEKGFESVVTVTKNNPWLIAGAFAIGLGIGGFAAYKWADRKLTTKYDQILEEQMEATRRFYERATKTGPFESPKDAVETLVPEAAGEAIRTYQGKGPIPYDKPDQVTDGVKAVAEAVVEKHNVFVDSIADPRDWDYDEELKRRAENPDAPYVISFEEFSENEPGHQQEALHYYAGDDTLADPQDQMIPAPDQIVGDDNLTRFGAGSHDPLVVYVRNERLDTDFEVIRSDGKFSVEVMGEEESSLKHSERHPNRVPKKANLKFRGLDE